MNFELLLLSYIHTCVQCELWQDLLISPKLFEAVQCGTTEEAKAEAGLKAAGLKAAGMKAAGMKAKKAFSFLSLVRAPSSPI
jgi:hypothetical protein